MTHGRSNSPGGALRAARESPAFALYLVALAALGFKWLSPISAIYERAEWSDILLAAAAAAWLLERVRNRTLPRPRVFHLLLLAYVGITLISAAFAEAQVTGARNLLLATELVVLAILTSEFASDQDGLNAIVLVITGLALATAALAVVGVALFYAGVTRP